MLYEDYDFFNSLLNFWEIINDKTERIKISNAWPVNKLLKCSDFTQLISVKGILSILSYYALDGLKIFFLFTFE
jgi:hypothetical protein